LVEDGELAARIQPNHQETTMRRTLFILLVLLLASACTDDGPIGPEPPDSADILREWAFVPVFRTANHWQLNWETRLGGVVDESRDHGPMIVYPSGTGPNARSQVYANETGKTYWASTQAPSVGTVDSTSAIGSLAALRQTQQFRKTSPDATLRYTITGTVLELMDYNANEHGHLECPWRQDGDLAACAQALEALVEYDMRVYIPDGTADPPCARIYGTMEACIYSTGAMLTLSGFRSNFSSRQRSLANGRKPLWQGESPFVLNTAVAGDPGHARVHLPAPLPIDIPLDSVPVGAEFHVQVELWVSAINLRQRESYVSSWFRDPASSSGLDMAYLGLTPVAVSGVAPGAPYQPAAHPPACTPGVTPTGTVQFAAPAFANPESSGRGRVIVSRTGGSSGAVSLLFTTADGTATADSDYLPVETYVLFDDGEEGERLVVVPLLDDAEREDNETISLTLTLGNGCGMIGSPAQATLTILDDDGPPPEVATYTVGGTVNGLVGTNLVLGVLSQELVVNANGPFVFPQPYVSGMPYAVRIDTHPSNPAQTCAVLRSQGTIQAEDVTNIEVTCEPPVEEPGLDLGFGAEGKVTTGVPGGVERIALQPDGRIVVVGGRTLARYLPDGRLDTSFGSGGQVTSSVYGSSDKLRGVAIQPDGRIVVAGYTRSGVNSPTDWDFLVARYNADGSPDLSFGNGGFVLTDFSNHGDQAEVVMIQDDGRIVVVGSVAAVRDQFLNADFGVARYNADGSLDTSFAGSGRVAVEIAGRTDLAATGALQPDGRILVGGRVANGGGDEPDVGIIRLNPDGTLDAGFGTNGIARYETDRVWDEVREIALQPDGRIVAVGLVAPRAGPYGFLVIRLEPNGDEDRSFGSNGVALGLDFGGVEHFGRAVAIQPDGHIVVGGFASDGSFGDFAIARLTPDGVLDTGFGEAGRLRIDFFGAGDEVNAIAIQADGAIIAAGSARNGTNTDIGMVRIRP
jgi:uncharacterized delta-60 repeat protein